MTEVLDSLINAERFSMSALFSEAWPLIEADAAIATSLTSIRRALSPAHYRKLQYAILRQVFLIELVKQPRIETTKFRARWCNELAEDPRGCSYEECLQIAHSLLIELSTTWLTDASHRETLTLFFDYGLLPYEVPIDYKTVPSPLDTTTRLHCLDNLSWTFDRTMARTLKLRQFLTDPGTSPDAYFFKRVLDDKIKVKTYLTDRVLTGPHKTNREKRWETHLASVHFATRRDAMTIEYTLVTQLCSFEGFPSRSRETLQSENILPANIQTFRCPVTREPLSFTEFRNEIENRTHGKSKFQVGHLNPLKLNDPSDIVSGHTADNISWISEDGNRIQGSLNLNDVRALLRKISTNYEQTGWT